MSWNAEQFGAPYFQPAESAACGDCALFRNECAKEGWGFCVYLEEWVDAGEDAEGCKEFVDAGC
jgi:hypothetical protein